VDHVSEVDDQVRPVAVHLLGDPPGPVVGEEVGVPRAAALAGRPDVGVGHYRVPEQGLGLTVTQHVLTYTMWIPFNA
jgi:hypothetical protein